MIITSILNRRLRVFFLLGLEGLLFFSLIHLKVGRVAKMECKICLLISIFQLFWLTAYSHRYEPGKFELRKKTPASLTPTAFSVKQFSYICSHNFICFYNSSVTGYTRQTKPSQTNNIYMHTNTQFIFYLSAQRTFKAASNTFLNKH